MGVLIRAIVSGFGFSLGAALYKKAAKAAGFEEEADKDGKDADKPQRVDPDVADDGEINEGEQTSSPI